jgi:hypothetical protein
MLRDEVKNKTSLPIPRIIAWSSKAEDDSVGTDYIIMEHVSGVALNEIWSQMTEVQHIDFIERLEGLIKELCTLDFTAVESLYFNTADKLPNAHRIDEEYCIGPHCGRQFWGYNDDQTAQTAVPLGLQGPCKSQIQLRFMSMLADPSKGKICLPFSQISRKSAKRR